ncbi:MAG: hypothetical protein N4A35_12795 [Flavobacteriales bacterium]|jgi:uncharacterized protein (TIGR02145 family)|nr:hypothetical protein [Flavobacteriales bacterium]
MKNKQIKSFYLLIVVLLGSYIGVAQNVGVNQANPSHSLHVSPVNLGEDPLRIDGLQTYSVGDTSLLMINSVTGVVKYINPTDFIAIINDQINTGTDNQNMDSLTLEGVTLNAYIENGTAANISLQPLIDSSIHNVVNHADTLFSNESFKDSIVALLYHRADTLLSSSIFVDNLRDSIDTDVDSITFVGNTLTIYENGNGVFVDLSALNSADNDPQNEIQDLNLTGNNLSITNNDAPNVIDLSPYLDNTDAQTLSLLGNTLSISNGNSVTIVDNVDDADNNVSNELQTISKSGSMVTLSHGGGSFIDDNTQLSEAQVDAYTSNNGYLTTFTEIDGSVSNELQTISKSGSMVTLSHGGGSFTDDNTQLSEAQVDAYTSNNGYLTTFTEIDGSVSNELQTISKSGSMVTLSHGGGSFTDDNTQLSEAQVDAYTSNNGYLTTFTEVDGNVGNEYNISVSLNGTTLSVVDGGGAKTVNLSSLRDGTGTDSQTLNLTGNTLSISGGNSVALIDRINDADADSTNEIQALSLSGNVLSLSNGGGNIMIPSSADNLGSHIATQNLDIANKKLVGNGGSVGILIQNDGHTRVENLPQYSHLTDTLLTIADAQGNIHALSLEALANLLINSYGVQGIDNNYPSGSVYCSGRPTAILDVLNPITNKTWMDRNLGAIQAAASSNDTASFGDLYQWGRFSDGHQCRTSSIESTIASNHVPLHGNFIVSSTTPFDWLGTQNIGVWQGIHGENSPCPNGYRLPTEAELEAERQSWNTNNTTGAFGSPIRLPEAGGRNFSNGNLIGNLGGYWSSTVNSTFSRFLTVNAVGANVMDANRANGYSVRCIKGNETPSVSMLNCSSASHTGTLIAGTVASGVNTTISYSGGNGLPYTGESVLSSGVTGLTATLNSGVLAAGIGNVTYNISGTPSSSGTANFSVSLGGETCVFSVSVSAPSPTYPTGTVHCSGTPTAVIDVVNPTTNKTWMDRNLGASQAATATTDAAAYGDLYQWGRAADGHQCRTSTTTSTTVSNNTVGHNNFIATGPFPGNSPYDWRIPQNSALWQGINGANNPCPSGYRLPTEAELEAERLSWSSNDISGAIASVLRIPLAGYRVHSSGALNLVGSNGFYWSSTVSNSDSRVIEISSNGATIRMHYRSRGFSVRCIKN